TQPVLARVPRRGSTYREPAETCARSWRSSARPQANSDPYRHGSRVRSDSPDRKSERWTDTGIRAFDCRNARRVPSEVWRTNTRSPHSRQRDRYARRHVPDHADGGPDSNGNDRSGCSIVTILHRKAEGTRYRG